MEVGDCGAYGAQGWDRKFFFVKECQEKHDVCRRDGEHGFGEENADGKVTVSFPGSGVL